MALQLSYTLEFQINDPNNVIFTQANPNVTLPLINDTNGDQNITVPAGQVDMPLTIVDPSGADFVLLIPASDASFKIGSTTSFPLPVKAGRAMMLDSKSIPAVFVSNPDSVNPIKVRFIQARTTP